MKPFPIELKGDIFTIDNSNLSTISTCPRSAFYKLVLKRRKVKSRAALFFGGAIHKALEVRDLEQAALITQEVEDKMLDKLVETYDGTEWDANEYRTLDYAIKTIQHYNKLYKFDALTAINLPSGEVAVELPFALHIGDVEVGQNMLVSDPDLNNGEPTVKYFDKIKIVFTGKIDRIVRKDGAVFLLDHKTTSMGGPTFFQEFYTSLQFKGYKWATEQLLGEPVAGVIINGLVCRPPLKSGGINFTFDRDTIYLDDSVIEEWQNSFMITVQEYLNYFFAQSNFPTQEQSFPMRTAWCAAKYGLCEYYDVCQLPVLQRGGMVMGGLYEPHTWSPLEEEGKPKVKREAIDFGDFFK